MSIKRLGFTLIMSLLLLSACAKTSQNVPQIDDFSFTNQFENPFGMTELNDSIWIANFIFTNCTTVCAPMSVEMASLQQLFNEKGLSVQLVSFTVDPKNDSPEVLKDYVLNFTDDMSNWYLLTGYSQEAIEVFAREQFKTIVQKPTISDQVIHSSNFYLVDQQGHLINEYNFIDSSYADNILKDVQTLSAK